MLFPFHFVFMGAVVFIVGLVLIMQRTGVSVILMGIGATILTGTSGIEIDKERLVYREYMGFFFMKTGRWIRFEGIEKIFINSTRVTRTMYGPMSNHSASFTNRQYNAFLKFDDGKKIHLSSKGNKTRLINRVSPVADALEVPIDDQTVVQAV